MPITDLTDRLHAEKYRAPGEPFREWANRVANALKDDDAHFHRFRALLLSQRFLPAGRIQAAMGSPKHVTAFNCFVSGTIEDNFTGPDGIMARATEAAQTMRMGGGIGYDFSTLRPRGTRIASLGSRSSGPITFMDIYDAICRATASAGNRRGAQMGVLRVDHPDVEEFVRAKQNANRLTGFNVSLAVTDEFMRAVRLSSPIELRWDGRTFGSVDAASLWEEVMRSTWDWAEPGVLFVDRINQLNNLWYCEKISATNPCGEQPLPPYGACLLGSFNLTKYVADGRLNRGQLAADVPDVVRALDNVIDRTSYPLPEQQAEAKDKRRIGLGVTGLANAAEALGLPYGGRGMLALTADTLSTIRDAAYLASAALAAEKGAFPLYDRNKYLGGEFVATLPSHVRDEIAAKGIRNSHLTSIAPTGTISLCADNVSSGIEPVYQHQVRRSILTEDGPAVVELEDYALREWGVRGRTAEECSLDDHLGVLITAQQYVDSAVSKTINVGSGVTWEEFKGIYSRAWEGGCKGVTTYRTGGERGSVFVQEGGACKIDPATGIKTCDE